MKHLLLIIVLIFFSYSYSKTIFGSAEYVYGDAETLLDAKAKCMSLAKQDAIEKFATFISSESVVRNYVTERSEIVTSAQGMITDIKEITENRKGEKKDGQLIFAVLPRTKNLKTWMWKFDNAEEYNPGKITYFSVQAMEFQEDE